MTKSQKVAFLSGSSSGIVGQCVGIVYSLMEDANHYHVTDGSCGK